MALIFDSLIYDLTIAISFVAICLYLFFTSTFNYWKDRGVPYIKPLPFFGNLKDQVLGRKGTCDLYQGLYDELKGHPYGGFFEIKSPVLLVRDPQLVEKILIKDFNHFYNRGFYSNSELDPLTANLFNLEDRTWRNLRYKLTPTFTTGKLKGMFEQICNCGGELLKTIEKESKINKAIESKPLLSAFAYEVIASVAFGLQLDKDDEGSKNFRKVVEAMFKPNKRQMLRFLATMYSPNIARKLGIKQIPQHLEDVIMQIIRGTLDYRRDNSVNRKDFLQLMLNLQKQEKDVSGTDLQMDLDYQPEDEVIYQMEHLSKDEDEDVDDITKEKQKELITESCIAAQSFVFLTAGSESISSTLNFALYSLAQNPKVQEKAHKEIDSVLSNYNNEWSYQAVKEMTYLEQVVQETLRLYPVAAMLFRICTEPYKIPDSSLVIEKGTRIIIPVMAIMNDPDNYKSPEVFDPDRFMDNNFKPSGIYLPFGDGPRICIAMRFAVLEVKMVIARILSQYTVKLSSKTKLPLKFLKNSLFLVPENGFWFEFDRRAKA